jgi:hypothetical protein
VLMYPHQQLGLCPVILVLVTPVESSARSQ